MSTAKHKQEAFERRIFEALQNWFVNELSEDVAATVQLTRVRLTTDKRQLTVYFTPQGDEDPAEVGKELERFVYAMADAVELELRGRRPELRLEVDKGARNAARVQQILEELHGRGELPRTDEPREDGGA